MRELKGWIIYSNDDYKKNSEFAQRFIAQGPEHGMDIKLVLHEELIYGVKSGRLSIEADLEPGFPDFVINRTLDSLLAEQFEALDIKVFNNSEVSRICNNKAKTYLEAVKLGLPVLDTLFLSKKELILWDQPFNWPGVLKSVAGRGGKEVFKVNSGEEIRKIAASSYSEHFVLQKMCGSPGRDVRVFVMGKQIIGAIERYAENDFKATYSLGAQARLYSLKENEVELVTKIVNRFDFAFVGIDFIFDENGHFIFNEIEDVVGSRTLSIHTDVNVVQRYLDLIRDCMDAGKI